VFKTAGSSVAVGSVLNAYCFCLFFGCLVGKQSSQTGALHL